MKINVVKRVDLDITNQFKCYMALRKSSSNRYVMHKPVGGGEKSQILQPGETLQRCTLQRY